MDNKKHQFALECYSKIAKAREDLRAMLDIIGLPIEALNIDEHHSTYIVTVDDVCEKIGNKKLIAVSDNEKQAMKTCEHQQALVKKFSDERGRYKNDMMSLAFDIIQTIRTLRADAHGLEVITHGERQRMREEGTEVRNFDSMAGNKEKLKGYAYTSEINFRDTFREAFHRSANEIVYRIDFDTVVSGLEHMFFTDGNEKKVYHHTGKAEFQYKGYEDGTRSTAPKCVFRVPQYWYQHCIQKNMQTLWRDSDRYTVTVNGKLWMPMKLKKVEHPYYADEPHKQAYKCKLLRVQSDKKRRNFFNVEIREGWLVADVRDGSNIVMAFNEDFRKADRQLDTKVTTDVVDSLDI